MLKEAKFGHETCLNERTVWILPLL